MIRDVVSKRGRVLIVDDEQCIIDTLRRILRSEHDIIASTQPTEALPAIMAGGRYDAILCDLMMPRLRIPPIATTKIAHHDHLTSGSAIGSWPVMRSTACRSFLQDPRTSRRSWSRLSQLRGCINPSS